MIKHYIKLSFRNIFRNKLYSIINILGLSVALASSFLILLYVLHETGFDRYNKKLDQIHRICYGSDNFFTSITPYPLADVLKSELPGVSKASRIKDLNFYAGGQFVKLQDEYIRELYFKMCDPDIFDIISLNILSGDPNNLLNDPLSIVISQKASEKYFPDQNPVGQILIVKNNIGEKGYLINGVFEDIPSNSTFIADFIGLVFKDDDDPAYDWRGGEVETLILLTEKSNHKDLDGKLPDIIKKYNNSSANDFSIQPLKEIYFHSSHMTFYDIPRGDLSNIYLFSAIAILILIIACINYINYSTAKSLLQIKEIGVRKVVGSSRKSLIFKILGDSIILSFCALPLAIMISEMLLPYLNQLLNKNLVIDYFENWQFTLGFIIITLFTGLVSGSYLAFYMSKFQPVTILYNRLGSGKSKPIIRKILLIFQLLIFIILILCTSLINKQLKYINKVYQGFDKNNLISVEIPYMNVFTPHYETYINEIKGHPDIIDVAGASTGLLTGKRHGDVYTFPGNDSRNVFYTIYYTDADYLSTLKFEIIEGRYFNKDLVSDSMAILLNETAVKEFEIEDPIGSSIQNKTIIGIVKDFYYESMHSKISPVVFNLMTAGSASQIMVRTNGENNMELVDYLKNKWEELDKSDRFTYNFIDQKIESAYGSEKRFKTTINTFTILAIFLASLGLFGFSMFSARQRTREIGIRKVFGASIFEIIKLISKEFLLIAVYSNIIAIPVSLYIMNKWLENFEYKTSIGVGIFIVAIIISLLIVMISLSSNIIQASNRNPADTLRYE